MCGDRRTRVRGLIRAVLIPLVDLGAWFSLGSGRLNHERRHDLLRQVVGREPALAKVAQDAPRHLAQCHAEVEQDA